MFGLPSFLRDVKREAQWRKERLETAAFVEWHDKIKWEPRLNVKASSYHIDSLFDVEPVSGCNPNAAKPGQFVDSPNRMFRYQLNMLPKGTMLSTWYGSKVGDVMFDGNVAIPALYERDAYWTGKHKDKPVVFEEKPWMSLTPAEKISLRGGTKLAKGRVVIAGLGVGYQLLEVAKRKSVKEIVLVECSSELVDWLMLILRPKVRAFGKPLEVIVGDAMEVVPKLKADVALIDIFKGYGNNDWEVTKIRSAARDIARVWGWGTAAIHGGLW